MAGKLQSPDQAKIFEPLAPVVHVITRPLITVHVHKEIVIIGAWQI